MSAGKHTAFCLFSLLIFSPFLFSPPTPYSSAIRDWFSPLSLCLLFHWSSSISPGQFPHISTRGQGRRADTHCLPWPMDPASQWKMSFGEAINCIQFRDEGRNKFLFSEVWRKGEKSPQIISVPSFLCEHLFLKYPFCVVWIHQIMICLHFRLPFFMF